MLQHLLVTPCQLNMPDEYDCSHGRDRVQRRVEDEHRAEPADVRPEDALRERCGDAEVREARRGRGRTRAKDCWVINDGGDRAWGEAKRSHGGTERVVDDRRADREGQGAAQQADELVNKELRVQM